MMKKLFLLMIVVSNGFLLTNQSWAEDYFYQAKVEGMVCGFCAYNISKKISQIASVDTASIEVELKTGEIHFSSSSAIKKNKISKAFADSGFSLIKLTQVTSSSLNQTNFSSEPLLSLKFSAAKIKQLETILEVIGNMAVSQPGLLNIESPQSAEIELLKPILAGRQSVIKVQFVAVESKIINIKFFPQASKSKK